MANQLGMTTWLPATGGAATYRSARAGAPLSLLLGFLALTFVGTHPMASVEAGARADGDVLDRIAVLGLFAMACVHLWRRRAHVATFAARNVAFFAVIGVCVSSILWSDYPALTLRRGMLLGLLALIAFTIALTIDDVRRMHTRLFVAMTAIVLINIVATLALPGRAISPLGVQGIYTQKNVAGAVAMIAAIVAATWIAGASTTRSKFVGALALVPILGFLVATNSKTSINLTLIGLVIAMFADLVERFKAPIVLLAVFVGSLCVVALLAWLGAYDFDIGAATSALIGDTSFTGRDELWAFVRRAANRRYWLGHGYGAYWDVGQANDPLLRAEAGSWLASVDIGTINQAHQGYLELWLHIGVPATAAATVIVAARAARGAFGALFTHRSREWRAFLACMTLIVTLNLLHNFTEATFFMRGAQFWNFAMLAYFAIAAALYRVREARP